MVYDEKLVLDNLGLVYKVCNKYRHGAIGAIDCDDLVAEGTIELIRSAEEFDLSKGVKFSSYATTNIQGKIKNYVRLWNLGVKFSARTKEDSWHLIKNGLDNLNTEQIMKKTGWTQYRTRMAVDHIKYKNPRYFEEVVGKNKSYNPIRLKDTIGYELDEDEKMIMEDFVDSLSLLQKTALELYLKGFNCREIGELEGVSTSAITYRIRDIYEKAIEYGEKHRKEWE